MTIPGILENSWPQIEARIETVYNKNLDLPDKKKISKIQIDFCDGRYVKSKTWTPILSSLGNKNTIEGLIENGLPYWQNFEYEADLMVEDLKSYIDVIVELGFAYVVLHSQSQEELTDAIVYAKDKMLIVGISSTDMDLILSILNIENKKHFTLPDYIQIMGIKNIGMQGQPFDEETLNEIKFIKETLNKNNQNIKIQIDGGMNRDTIELCRKAGATHFVEGSAYFKI